MKKILLLIILGLSFQIISYASKIHPLDFTKLNQISSIVVVGEVIDIKKIDEIDSTSIFDVTIEKLSIIKGSMIEDRFVLPMHIGGLKGFDVMLQKNKKYVFFVNPEKRRNYFRLAYPGAVAKFEK